MKKPSPSFLRATFRYDAETGFLWWRERGHGRRFSKPAGSMGHDPKLAYAAYVKAAEKYFGEFARTS